MVERRTVGVGPLDGLVVVDLSRAVAGPHATMMLADMGARVIKVESPAGDDSRRWGPPWIGAGADRESTYFLSVNRNKESVVLDLTAAADRLVLDDLVRRADVLVENFRVGRLARLGYPIERLWRLNPSLILLSITAFGHDGPAASRAGYDQIVQGEAGLMSLTGDALSGPTKVGVPIADVLAGMNAAFGVLCALVERERTGRGRIVRTSLLASVVGALSFQATRWTVAGEVPGPAGTHHPAIAPYGAFRAADGVLQVACGSEALWRAFASCLGLDAEDSRFADNDSRVRRRAELTVEIEQILHSAPAAVWIKRLDDAGVPVGRIRTLEEVFEWEQTASQGLLVDVDDPRFGTLRLPGPTIRFDDLAHAGGRAQHDAPPALGGHTAQIKQWLRDTRSSELQRDYA